MEDEFNTNWCKVYFIAITVPMFLLSILINLCEPYLPIVIRRAFRYGKFSVKQGPKILKHAEVPKAYFKHFYLSAALFYLPVAYNEIISVFIFESEVVDWFKYVLDVCCGSNRVATVSSTRIFIVSSLLVLQVYRRCFDTLFVSVFSRTARMNLSHYIIGMTYYPAVILTLLSEAPHFAPGMDHSKVRLTDIGLLEVAVVVVFLWAWYHQHIATVILAELRKNSKGEIVNEQYKIPTGDWFDYLSSPHSTAEIVMYFSLTVLLWTHTGWWYVFAWVVINQVQTILMTHWWYKRKFDDFPSARKALIPFVY